MEEHKKVKNDFLMRTFLEYDVFRGDTIGSVFSNL